LVKPEKSAFKQTFKKAIFGVRNEKRNVHEGARTAGAREEGGGKKKRQGEGKASKSEVKKLPQGSCK